MQTPTPQRNTGPAPITTKPGDVAWFVCRHGRIADDVLVPLRPGSVTTEADLFSQGRMRAARRFKARHGLHPCVTVECELQAVGPKEALS